MPIPKLIKKGFRLTSVKLSKLDKLRLSPERKEILRKISADLSEKQLHKESAILHAKRAAQPKLSNPLVQIIKNRAKTNENEVRRLEGQIQENRDYLRRQRMKVR